MTHSSPPMRSPDPGPQPLAGEAILPAPALAATPFSPAASPDPAEAEALARAQSGDHHAFAQLYSLHKRRIYSLCLRMVGDIAEAEDLTQEVFLQLHRKIATFRGDSAFSTWLHRLAINVVLMRLRKKGLSLISLDEAMEPVPEEGPGRSFGAPDLPRPGPSTGWRWSARLPTCPPAIGSSLSSTTSRAMSTMRSPPCSTARSETANPSCTRRGSNCATPCAPIPDRRGGDDKRTQQHELCRSSRPCCRS